MIAAVMPSERIQRRIDSLLDEADEAVARLDWETVRARAEAALVADPGNDDATSYLEMAARGLAGSAPPPSTDVDRPTAPKLTPTAPPHPERFAGDR